MFVRKKTTASGAVKHYLVESRREGGKVRQKVLHYLGKHPTVEERLAWLDDEVSKCCRMATELYAEVDATAKDLKRYCTWAHYGTDRQIWELIQFYEYEIHRHKAEAGRLREIIRSAQ
jgi:hypothetical protein